MDVDMSDEMHLLFEILEPVPQNPDFMVEGLEDWEEQVHVQPLENMDVHVQPLENMDELPAEWLMDIAEPAQAAGSADVARPLSALGQHQAMGAVQPGAPMLPAGSYQAPGPALPAEGPEAEPLLEAMGPAPKRPRLEDPLYDLGIDISDDEEDEDVDLVVNPVRDIDNPLLMASVGNKIHRPKYYPKYREYLMNSRFIEKVRQCVLFYQTMGFIDARAPPSVQIQEVLRIFEK